MEKLTDEQLLAARNELSKKIYYFLIEQVLKWMNDNNHEMVHIDEMITIVVNVLSDVVGNSLCRLVNITHHKESSIDKYNELKNYFFKVLNGSQIEKQHFDTLKGSIQ